ncbi:MAG TPA: DUF692 domain-containing protein [Moraxellaceae bacterium]|nr:DUF692 domain-containing protein [Moraxellaceae bacterium]
MADALHPPARRFAVQGAGLGLRRAFLAEVDAVPAGRLPDFFEVAPENWMGMGGRYARQLRALTERFPFVCHGLSLSIGGTRALDRDFLRDLRGFLDTHQVRLYSEHLSYTTDEGHLYDLLPIPFTEEAVDHVAARVREVQDLLGRRIALENVSYYAAPGARMSELEFLLAVLERADCDLLLDVNNIYVNSINHGYDAAAFLDALPAARVAYVHVAGHYEEAPDLRVDTHGSDVIPDVWHLLARAYARCGPLPTLLERDFNIPPLAQLLDEVETIRGHQAAAGRRHAV